MTIEVDGEILSCVPHRLAEWRVGEDGRVVVERPRPATRGLRGLRDRFEWFMTYPRIRLDGIGSEVWKAIDGVSTLAALAQDLSAKQPDLADADERVALFAAALQRQGLIELHVPAE